LEEQIEEGNETACLLLNGIWVTKEK